MEGAGRESLRSADDKFCGNLEGNGSNLRMHNGSPQPPKTELHTNGNWSDGLPVQCSTAVVWCRIRLVVLIILGMSLGG